MPLPLTPVAMLTPAALIASPSAATSRPDPRCDRACLETLADQFVQALLANDGSRLPLAKDFRYTENGQQLKVGDGLWGTLSAYAGEDPRLAPAAADLRYRLSVADPSSGQIVRLLAIDENRTKGLLALRIAVSDGAISEAEALAVREEFVGARAGTVTLFQPRLLVMLDGGKLSAPDPAFMVRPAVQSDADAMIRAAVAYFDAIEKGRVKGVPLAADCIRRDNGIQTSNAADAPPLDAKRSAFRPFALGCAAQIDSGFYSYIGSIRDRRFVVDPEHGLLIAFAMVDTPGTTLSFEARGVGRVDYPGPRGTPAAEATSQFEAGELGAANMIAPSTAHTATLFKFDGGNIKRIDSFARPGPYGLRSGWPMIEK